MKHPERYRAHPPAHHLELDPLGDPPPWLKPAAAECWYEIRDGMPWLDYSHRGIATITALAWARWRAGDTSSKLGNLFRLCLQSMGATPATEHLRRPN